MQFECDLTKNNRVELSRAETELEKFRKLDETY